MTSYVLIHGSWHGGWCWEKVVPLLERAGHEVEAPDLPGHGNDETPISEISLHSYADRVCQVLDAHFEPVILVGHSMGGVVISQAAEYRPEKIKALVYLTGTLLRDGESVFEATRADTESLVPPNLILAQDGSSATLREEAVKELFYADCSDEDVVRAESRFVPELVAPLATPVKATEENFGRVPRTYIECRRDKAFSPSIQKRMYTTVPCRKVLSLDTGHAPFYAPPRRSSGPSDLAMRVPNERKIQ